MDQVLNALKCGNCREFLSTPVNLPCGHMICESHTQVTDEEIICAKCGSRHPNKGFIVNHVFSDLISAQLNKLDFGQQHSETSKSCNELKSLIDKNDAMVNDLEHFIHESVGELKNKVMLRSEQLKLRIDEITQEFIDDLDEYEKRCKINCEETNSKENFSSLLDEVKKQNEDAKKVYQEWSSALNELKVDVEKWAEIKVKCDEKYKKISKNVNDFQEVVFNNEFDKMKFKVEFFEKANIDSVLKKKIPTSIESTILDSALSLQFIELCFSKINVHNLKLLYRGSRDGFEATFFHSKCDNQPNTITIIKTTKDYIFGGYTQIGWNSNDQHYFDSNAFLYSLVNKFKKSFIAEVIDPSHAICCDSNYGPIFGKSGHDICILNNSNTSNNYSNGLSCYMNPYDIKDHNGYFFSDDKYFKVNEIEVFQIKEF